MRLIPAVKKICRSVVQRCKRLLTSARKKPLPESVAAESAQATVHLTRGSAYSANGRLSLLPWLTPARKYVLLMPADSVGNRNINQKLLVLLHGCKQDADLFAKGSDAQRLARDQDYLVLLPGQTRLGHLYRCWNWFDRSVAHGGGEVAIVMQAVAQVRAEFGIEVQNTFIAGMSSGAAIAASICVFHPEQFAGAVFHSGLPHGASASALSARQVMKSGPDRDVTSLVDAGPGIRSLTIHGAQDDIVSPVHADELIRQMLRLSSNLAEGGVLPEADTVDVETHAGRRLVRKTFGMHQQIIVDQLAHAWSGGVAGQDYFDPSGPNALDLISAFCETHSIRSNVPIDDAV